MSDNLAKLLNSFREFIHNNTQFKLSPEEGPQKEPESSHPRQGDNNSDSELKAIWLALRALYFPDRAELDQYQIVWSKRRQIRVLASCNLHDLRVIVAKTLKSSEHHWVLDPLLYHEMCHAVLGKQVPQKNGRRRWHGREFKELEKLHPGIKDLNLWIKSGGWEKAIRQK